MTIPVNRRKRSGFTLVEVIVVLVILAILAALMIPSLTGWIDRTKQKTAIAEARSCLSALQTLCVEKYAAGEAYSLSADESKTLALAEAPAKADLQTVEVVNGKVQMMGYLASNGVRVTYKDGVYSFASFGNSEEMKTVKDVLQATDNGEHKPTLLANISMDSLAEKVSGSNAEKFVSALKDKGIDLAAMGATSWAYRPNSNGNFLYWTTQSIADKKIGDTIYVIRYNFTSGNYTVWNAKVEQGSLKGNSYNIIGNMTGKTLSESTNQTYDNAVKLLNEKISGS